MTKFIVVSGGVLSGLGKGIVSASIGRLLSSQYRVIPIKCDGYLNVDPGTMNPIEHGEVFVLDDGGEVDLDFGHYERFMNTDCQFQWNLTSGKIFQSLVEKERKGDFLGKTVQVVPHVTGEIKRRFHNIAKQEKADVLLIEVGGTVGDIENLWFLEAVRELHREVGSENILFIHLGLVPVLDDQGQQKTKPMQQSLAHLRERGIFPRVIVGRSHLALTKKTKEKLRLSCNAPYIISDPDTRSVYELPLIFRQEGLLGAIEEELGLKVRKDLKRWQRLVHALKEPCLDCTIGLCGKYTELADSYLSIEEALHHAGAHLGARVHLRWIETSDINDQVQAARSLEGCAGIIVPGGFGNRGVEGKIHIIRYARERRLPFLGICYGMQLAVVEFARHVLGIPSAHSTEVCSTPHPVVDLLPSQANVYRKGGTMRLGGHDVRIKRRTRAHRLFKGDVRRRFRHRYEVNPSYVKELERAGLVFSGKAPDEPIMQVLELPDHPFFMASQFHPELTSRLEEPAPLFVELVRTAAKPS